MKQKMKQNGQLLGAGQVDIVATGYYTPDVKRRICKKIRLNPCCSVIIQNYINVIIYTDYRICLRNAPLTTRSENRKRAYQYIKEQSEKLNLISDKAINDVNNISLDELIRLKDGLADPYLELVQALKKLFIGAASKGEIEDIFLDPFITKHDFNYDAEFRVLNETIGAYIISIV